MPGYNLPAISYAAAYFILPHYAFKEIGRIEDLWLQQRQSAGPFIYLMACQLHKQEPVREHALGFLPHHGTLDGNRDYFLMEYPAPPPVDFSGMDIAALESTEPPVLAPYYSAVVRDLDTPAVSYYVLGQSPIGGGTTFRRVEGDGINANLGPGPAPTMDDFLETLRTRTK